MQACSSVQSTFRGNVQAFAAKQGAQAPKRGQLQVTSAQQAAEQLASPPAPAAAALLRPHRAIAGPPFALGHGTEALGGAAARRERALAVSAAAPPPPPPPAHCCRR